MRASSNTRRTGQEFQDMYARARARVMGFPADRRWVRCGPAPLAPRRLCPSRRLEFLGLRQSGLHRGVRITGVLRSANEVVSYSMQKAAVGRAPPKTRRRCLFLAHLVCIASGYSHPLLCSTSRWKILSRGAGGGPSNFFSIHIATGPHVPFSYPSSAPKPFSP